MPAFPAPTPPRTTRARYGPPPPPPSAQRSPSAIATANARIVRTLEDTFRIAAGPEPEVLVIPPLGDRAVEREVRRVLGHHGVPARFRIEEEREEEMGMEMDVDLGGEREEVRPVYGYAHPHSHLRGYATGDGESEEEGEEGRGRECDLAWEDPEQERNIAGACFDPSGAYIYVASDAGVAEWGVRGAEKRWWVDGAWER